MNNPFQEWLSYNRFKRYLPIGSILILSSILYLYKLDRRGLWIDEFISILDAKKCDFNRGRLLYYIVLNLWMKIDDSDSWLRGLAIIFAMGSLVLLYQLGRYLFGEKIGLLAALMLAVSPLFINHAQEIRYYTMSVFFGIAGTLFLARALDRPGKFYDYFGWCLCRFLSLITTPLNGVLLFADFAIVIAKFGKQRSRLIEFGTGFLLIGIASIPAAISVKDSANAHILILPVPGIANVLRELRILTVFPYPPPPPYISTLLQGFIFMLLGLMGFAIYRQWRSEKFRWLLAFAFIPAASIFIFSHAFFSIWSSRYVMLVLPYLLAILAIGWREISLKSRLLALGIAAAYGVAVSGGIWTYYNTKKRYIGASDRYRDIAQLIDTKEEVGDIIVYSIVHKTDFPLKHYYRGSAPIYLKDLISGEGKKIEKVNTEKWLQELPPVRSRLWLVYGEQNPYLRAAIAERFKVKIEKTLDGTSVFLLEAQSQ